LKHCDVCQWEYEDAADECPYCRMMARHAVNGARFHRFAQFTDWLVSDGLELVFDMIGVLRYIRGGVTARVTNRSDNLPSEVSPHSARSKSVSARSRGATKDIDRANGGGSPLRKKPSAGKPISENAARKMDREQKMRLRERIGNHLDVSSARLKDDEVQFLAEFIEDYDSYRGQSQTRTSSHDDWSSDGKYTRREEYTDTFTDEVGIRRDYSYQDDDGQTGSASTEIKDARGILNWFRQSERGM